MKTLLIFAGRSTRFWPLTEKSLLPIVGKTLLEHQVERLKAGGAKEIVFVGGEHNLKDAKSIFPKATFIEQQDLNLGMRGALLSALPSFKKEPVMLVSANDVIDPSAYAGLIKKFKAGSVDGLLLAKKVKKYFPGGYITLQGKKIVGIMEKPGEGNEPSNMVNIVAHVHRDASVLLDALKKVKTSKDDGYEVALDGLFKTHHYEAVAYDGLWQAVKYPWHVLQLLEIFLQDIRKPRIAKSAKIHSTAVIEGNVIIGENVRLLPHSTVVGPAVIGDNTIIANNALVRQASVGPHCVVGYNTEVVRSVLCSEVWTHMSYVGDSVIARNVSFGGGTMTGNLRLDEGEISSVVQGSAIASGLTKFGSIIGEGVRTGVHCCISPGVKIGAGSFLASNILVDSDVPEESFVKWKGTTLDVRPNTAKKVSMGDREGFKKKI